MLDYNSYSSYSSNYLGLKTEIENAYINILV
jgi:hypothetical protein